MISSEAWLKMADRSMRAEQGATTRGQNEFLHSKSPYHCLARAHVGRPRSLLTFPKADITSFGSADRYGWICDGPLCDGATKNRTFVFRLDRAQISRDLMAGPGMAVSGR
jgi:hypothetical protein